MTPTARHLITSAGLIVPSKRKLIINYPNTTVYPWRSMHKYYLPAWLTRPNWDTYERVMDSMGTRAYFVDAGTKDLLGIVLTLDFPQ